MRFCPWYSLADGTDEAPASPGVFQVRLRDGLLDYPSGKSAMIHYEFASDLRAAVTGFAERFHRDDWLCRHTIEMSAKETEDVEAFHAKLLGDFRVRFGSEPRLPA